MNESEFPIAYARLKRIERQGPVPGVYQWIVDCCPLCGQQHAHGGGGLDGDPRQLLGHRVAHCTAARPPGGYVLVEAG